MTPAVRLLAAYGRQVARGLVKYRLHLSDVVRSFPAWWATTRNSADLSPVRDRQPWVTFAAIRYLETHVRGRARVFEYGVGGSTLFFLDRGAELTSVDHDPTWTRLIQESAPNAPLWELLTIPPDAAPAGEYGSRTVEGSLRAYVTAIDRYRAQSFDVVVIDGRAREACLRHAPSRVAPGGLLVLDNSERTWYAQAAARVDALGWRRHDFFGPGPYNLFFWQTTVWKATEAHRT